MLLNIPDIKTDSEILEKAYRIAAGDISGNITLFKSGLLKKEVPCILAGLDYDTPWTRDTAINVWNALAVISPETAKNTLLAVCENSEKGRIIGTGWHQYWDCMIWTLGAYHYCLVNNDNGFLKTVFEITLNTLKIYENNEFDKDKNLFRGPAVYGDGAGAYPDKYGLSENFSSSVLDWVERNPDKRNPKGYGLPMFSLSTNCMYYMVYKVCEKISEKLNTDGAEFKEKAEKLKIAVNKYFWNEKKGSYDYLAGECDYQEGLGISFAILSGIADSEKTDLLLKNTYISEHGIPCVWPCYERYLKKGNLGRHSGTVWPFIQGFWGQSLMKEKQFRAFDENLRLMAEKALKDGQFAEIYHSITGEIYGGLQENNNPKNQKDIGVNDIVMWKSARRQSWSATAFLSLIYYCVLGLQYNGDVLRIKPYLPGFLNEITVSDIPFGKDRLKITVKRNSDAPKEIILYSDNVECLEIELGYC